MRRWYIYALIDPHTLQVRYVGWSFNVEKRVNDHITKSRKEHTHKANWLNQLANDGLRPFVQILESGIDDWVSAERKWIEHFRSQNAPLTNLTSGGEGTLGCFPSEETRQKQSQAKRGKKLPPEHGRKIGERLRGKKRSQSTIDKIRSNRTPHKWTDEEKKKLSISVRKVNYRHTLEAKIKIANAGRRKMSDETKQKLSIAKKGKKLTSEHKLKLSLAKRGTVQSQESNEQRRLALTGKLQRCGLCGEYGHKKTTCSHVGG